MAAAPYMAAPMMAAPMVAPVTAAALTTSAYPAPVYGGYNGMVSPYMGGYASSYTSNPYGWGNGNIAT